METITISGILLEDVEERIDKKEHSYYMFRVCCKGKTISGRDRTTVYKCFTYSSAAKDLKPNDEVFLVGDLNLNVYQAKVSPDVFVLNFRRAEKIK